MSQKQFLYFFSFKSMDSQQRYTLFPCQGHVTDTRHRCPLKKATNRGLAHPCTWVSMFAPTCVFRASTTPCAPTGRSRTAFLVIQQIRKLQHGGEEGLGPRLFIYDRKFDYKVYTVQVCYPNPWQIFQNKFQLQYVLYQDNQVFLLITPFCFRRDTKV